MKEITCIVCPNGCLLKVDKVEDKWIIKGNRCLKGRDFAINEMTNAKRSICSTVRTIYKEIPRLPIRTDGEIPKALIFSVMKEINSININHPVHSGDIIINNVLNTEINIISTLDIYQLLQEDLYD